MDNGHPAAPPFLLAIMSLLKRHTADFPHHQLFGLRRLLVCKLVVFRCHVEER
jgi:hypothetical protein